jgi:serralysin
VTLSLTGFDGVANKEAYAIKAIGTLIGTGSAPTAYSGWGGIDAMFGTDRAETFNSGNGNDLVHGGGGNDRILLGAGNDTAFGEAGNDVIDGGAGNDKLNGDAGNDKLVGGTGNDTLYGGLGADDLYGGPGKDTFVFKTLAESKVAASGRDTIFDFSPSDRIDLSAIDADTKHAGNQEFDFIGTKAFSGQAGELRYVKMASDTLIYADTNGDKKADFAIHLDDAVTLKEGYLLL